MLQKINPTATFLSTLLHCSGLVGLYSLSLSTSCQHIIPSVSLKMVFVPHVTSSVAKISHSTQEQNLVPQPAAPDIKIPHIKPDLTQISPPTHEKNSTPQLAAPKTKDSIKEKGGRWTPMTSNKKPPYPRIARQKGQEGVVKLTVTINQQGHVAAIEISESCGYRALDKSALQTVQRWQFSFKGKTPHIQKYTLPIRFTLTSNT